VAAGDLRSEVIVSGKDETAQLLQALLPGMTWALERLYRAFLRVRPKLQRWMREREQHGG